ncbi:MAG: hypothetical protein R3C16_13940 [Hyphomonadaceae bacterium]
MSALPETNPARPVIDGDGASLRQHIHADQQGGAFAQTPDIEDVEIADIGDDIVGAQIAEIEFAQQQHVLQRHRIAGGSV